MVGTKSEQTEAYRVMLTDDQSLSDWTAARHRGTPKRTAVC